MLGEMDSTNAFLLRDSNAPDGAVVHAEFQSAGRGRLGRRWLAPRGSSVMLSALLREPAGSGLLELAPRLGAVAACEAIESGAGLRPAVRWPNDLALGGRKLAGVLVEAAAADAGASRIVIGVGINCLQQRGHFSGELADRATSLEIESPRPVFRERVARALVERLDELLSATPPVEVRRRWRERCQDVGQAIMLRHDGRTFCGTVLDIYDSGALLVELEDGQRRKFEAATTTRVWT
jgi:BirA family biotin operon repressor/biotin-[acetyl-CoA-carboxylase] ligase